MAELIAHERAAIVWFTAVKTIVAARFNTTPARWVCRPAVPVRLVAGGALFVLVATIAGCGTFMNSRQQALDKATAAVRAAAEQARVEQISKTSGGRVVRKAAGPDGTVDLEGTFIELRNSGGGGSYEDAAVLLCVRLSGKPGPQARVELADAPCPTNPTSRPPNFGSIDKIVTLS